MFLDKLVDRFSTNLQQPFHDPDREDRLKYQINDDRLVAEFRGESTIERLPIQFALGSGTHATTFVTLLTSDNGQPTLLEHRFSLFDNAQRMGLTPSHSEQPVQSPFDALGRIHKGKDATNCIGCHSTTGTIHGEDIDDLRPNVNCESCHGPGRGHIAAKRANREDASHRFTRGWSTPHQEIQMCGKCHRLPEMLSAPPSKHDPKLARFQPVGLLNSNCYKRSADRLRCSTCHNPHQTVDTVASNYVEKCRNCHSRMEDNHKICPQSPRENCISCHMPPVEVHPGISFHDHWIRVRTQKTKTD